MKFEVTSSGSRHRVASVFYWEQIDFASLLLSYSPNQTLNYRLIKLFIASPQSFWTSWFNLDLPFLYDCLFPWLTRKIPFPVRPLEVKESSGRKVGWNYVGSRRKFPSLTFTFLPGTLVPLCGSFPLWWKVFISFWQYRCELCQQEWFRTCFW